MAIEGTLSDSERAKIAEIRSQTDRVIDSVAKLQAGWNHGPRAMRQVDDAVASLKQASTGLES